MKEDRSIEKNFYTGQHFMQDNKRQTIRHNLTHTAIAFVLGALCIWVPRFLKQPFMGQPRAFEGKCTKIIDGDTIIVTTRFDGDFKVNLVSVTAPEKGEKLFTKTVQFTTKILLDNDVTVQPNRGVASGEVDAWVYAGPLCFNNELVKAGYAQYDNGDSRDAPVKALQDEAKESKRGLWSDREFKAQTN